MQQGILPLTKISLPVGRLYSNILCELLIATNSAFQYLCTTMKIVKPILTANICVVLSLFFSACSSSPKTSDIRDGRLDSCPGTPNCIQSEFPEENDHYFAPIDIAYYFSDSQVTNLTTLITDVLNTIESIDGRIIQQDQTYIHATFTSKIMRYVDDFEIRIDQKEKKLHLRSTSRVGYSDMGVNRKRAEQFKSEFIKTKSK